MRLVSFGLSEKGDDHKANEDRILIDDKRKLFAVADGVSIPSGGPEAAERALKYLKKFFKKDLDAALETINRKLVADKNKLPAIGYTTLTAVNLKDNLKVASVGDSPAYFVRQENIIPLNKLDKFFGTAALSQALGEEKISVNYSEHEIRNGDVILLATDGVTDVVNSREIFRIVKSFDNIKRVTNEIIGLAKSKEVVYKDDKSLIVVKIPKEN